MTSPSSLPPGWHMVTLADLIDIRHGFAFKGYSIHDEPQGEILLTPGNFAIGGGFKGDRFKYYDGSVPEDYILSEGDLLVTMTDLSKLSDTLGYPALVPANTNGHRFLHNQRLGKIILKGDRKICSSFMYYVMCSAGYRHEVLASATGTTVKHTSPDKIKRYRFNLPPLDQQRAIAHILGTLDDKIELNRRMNETLEAMARALFTSWFVDFEPVRAKMDGRWRRGESLPGLPAEHFDLFPDTLVPSQLGDIPEGWEVKALGEVIELNYGKALKADDRESGEVPVYGSNGQVGWHNESLAPGPGIVVGRKGNPGYITWTHTAFFPIDTTFYVETKDDGLSLPFLYFSLQDQDLPSLSADSAVPGLNRNLAYMNSQLLPAKLVVEAYHQQAMAMFNMRYQLEQESRALSEQRDALLPRLVSGEVKV